MLRKITGRNLGFTKEEWQLINKVSAAKMKHAAILSTLGNTRVDTGSSCTPSLANIYREVRRAARGWWRN